MAQAKNNSITVNPIETEENVFWLHGPSDMTMPGLYIQRMSAKAKRDLLIGSQKKTAAEKKKLKHDPVAEFVACMDVDPSAADGSAIRFPAMAIKSAMGTAALVTDGIRKTDVQRLIYIPQETAPIYGVPTLRMTVMRSADMNRTPDVRTRAYLPQWWTKVTIRWCKPHFNQAAVLNLLANAGIVCGIGDERVEKGKGSAGTFTFVTDDPSALLPTMDEQLAAIENPVAYDQDTDALLNEIIQEQKTRQ